MWKRTVTAADEASVPPCGVLEAWTAVVEAWTFFLSRYGDLLER